MVELDGRLKQRRSPQGTRRIIIVAPHFAPSNLASVHRSRFFASHLPEFGWEPLVVAVDPRHYEEALDWDLARLVPASVRVESVGALPTRPIRVVGDIGVRGFLPMLRRILRIIDREGADFLLITIPSFFAAPLGRVVHELRGVPYGIDYSDPWVHVWEASKKRFSKAWLSRKLAELLEPWSVRKASLIAGVSERTYEGVLTRNPQLRNKVVTATMPVGGEPADVSMTKTLGLKPYLFDDRRSFRIVYAGSMWESARATLDSVFAGIAASPEVFADVQFQFIGTGVSPTDPQSQIKPIAERHGIWNTVVREHPARIPYCDVLTHLEAADAIFIFGSTSAHYTPSKLFQSALSGRPIFAVLHEASTACDIIRQSGLGHLLTFRGDSDLPWISQQLPAAFEAFRAYARTFDANKVDLRALDAWSARGVTQVLAEALDRIVRPSAPASVVDQMGVG